MRKKIISLLMGFLMVLSTSIPAYALDMWGADEDIVSYNSYNGSYYVSSYSTNTSFNTSFYSAVDEACYQWNNALPISIYSSSFNYALSYIYGGTFNQLSPYFPTLTTGDAGITVAVRGSLVDTVSYNGSTKEIYKLLSGAKAGIVEIDGFQYLPNYCTNVALHEMGHMFGWCGHSSFPWNVMYEHVSSLITLSSVDRGHLFQIYDAYYS
ncbi:MAG: hypothetical protein IKR78_01675 [Dehalococcoidales bacterium]|nr:hypothetical protein [Dehalococcoidales bacterium]